MVCGKCWKDVSGGVVDGDATHPYLWWTMEKSSSCSKVMCILLHAATKYMREDKRETIESVCIIMAHFGVAIMYVDLLIQYGLQKPFIGGRLRGELAAFTNDTWRFNFYSHLITLT
jgi:hypothetical protein